MPREITSRKNKKDKAKLYSRGLASFGLLLGAFLILTGLSYQYKGLQGIYGGYEKATVCFYLTRSDMPETLDFSIIKIISNGTGIIAEMPASKAADLRLRFKNLKGESVCFDGGAEDAESVIKFYRAKIIKTEKIPLLSFSDKNEDNYIKVFYGFSRSFDNYIRIDGEKVNIQIAVNTQSGKVTVGTPIILGSY